MTPILLTKLESSAQEYTALQIKNALNYQGTPCLLYKKKKVRASDEVYGVYAGSDLSNLPSISVYDSSAFTQGDLTDEEIINLNQFELPNREVIIDDSYEQPLEITALVTAWAWRAIEDMNSGILDDPVQVFVENSDEISVNDVLRIDRGDDSFRLKVFSIQTIGNQTHIVKKLLVSMIGD